MEAVCPSEFWEVTFTALHKAQKWKLLD